MKTFYIKLGTAHAQVNLTDEEYQELQRLSEEEKGPVDQEKIKGLILQAIDNLKKQSALTDGREQRPTV